MTLSAQASDPSFFSALSVGVISGGTAMLGYTPAGGKTGAVTITVLVSDGQAANGSASVRFPLVLFPARAAANPPAAASEAATTVRTLCGVAPGGGDTAALPCALLVLALLALRRIVK